MLVCLIPVSARRGVNDYTSDVNISLFLTKLENGSICKKITPTSGCNEQMILSLILQ